MFLTTVLTVSCLFSCAFLQVDVSRQENNIAGTFQISEEIDDVKKSVFPIPESHNVLAVYSSCTQFGYLFRFVDNESKIYFSCNGTIQGPIDDIEILSDLIGSKEFIYTLKQGEVQTLYNHGEKIVSGKNGVKVFESPDADRLTYLTYDETDSTITLHVNDKKILHGDFLLKNISWSQDGKKFICCISKEDKSVLYVDGVETAQGDQLGFSWSPQGHDLAWIVNNDGCWSLYRNGKTVVSQASDISYYWSPDGKLVYKSLKDGLWTFTVDEKVITSGVGIDFFVSPNQKKSVYVVSQGNESDKMTGQTLYIDGEKIHSGNVVTPFLSPDEMKCAFIDLVDSNEFPAPGTLYLDQKELVQAKQINLFWSPQGHRLAYSYVSQEDATTILSLNGKELIRVKDSMIFPTWAPDSSKIAYEIHQNDPTVGQHIILFVNDKEIQKFQENVFFGSKKWSPDSQKYAYTTLCNGKATLWIDGKKMIEGDSMSNISWSPDSQSVAGFVKNGDEMRLFSNQTIIATMKAGEPVYQYITWQPHATLWAAWGETLLPSTNRIHIIVQGKTYIGCLMNDCFVYLDNGFIYCVDMRK